MNKIYKLDDNLEIINKPDDKDIMQYQHNSVNLRILFPSVEGMSSAIKLVYNNEGTSGVFNVEALATDNGNELQMDFPIPQPCNLKDGKLKFWLVLRWVTNDIITRLQFSQTMVLNVVKSDIVDDLLVE